MQRIDCDGLKCKIIYFPSTSDLPYFGFTWRRDIDRVLLLFCDEDCIVKISLNRLLTKEIKVDEKKNYVDTEFNHNFHCALTNTLPLSDTFYLLPNSMVKGQRPTH